MRSEAQRNYVLMMFLNCTEEACVYRPLQSTGPSSQSSKNHLFASSTKILKLVRWHPPNPSRYNRTTISSPFCNTPYDRLQSNQNRLASRNSHPAVHNPFGLHVALQFPILSDRLSSERDFLKRVRTWRGQTLDCRPAEGT